tara:strand:+ start:1128 stop:1979 length:852 start_codon:yes stop_codon:yes gene_type:complete
LNKTLNNQKDFWSGKGGEVWVKNQISMDLTLAPLGDEALSKLDIRENSSVLDVGCGCGTTTIEIAKKLGSIGRVTGVDISIPMINKANINLESTKLHNIKFILSDVEQNDLTANFNDAIYSRFGVMFFNNPEKAFHNIFNSLNIRGRISFVCWQKPTLNPWQYIAMQSIKRFIQLPETPKEGPGPFSFKDKNYILDLMKKTNFKKISITNLEKEIYFFKNHTIVEAAQNYLSINPTVKKLIDENSQIVKTKILDSIIESFLPYHTKEGLKFPSSCWVVEGNKK